MDEQKVKKVFLYDTTLRDGAQCRGISYSINDKLKITKILDDFGVSYIECGWPGSNPKDCEFFNQVKTLNLKQAKIVAFGSTRKKNIKPQDDANILGLLEANTPAVAIFGKSWNLHVEKVLETTLDENLAMINDSVAYLCQQGREVVYDAEHFFDGYLADSAYALKTLQSAAQGGASWLVLCDTNGGSLPGFVQEVVSDVYQTVVAPLRAQGKNISVGIHTHNDSELAVANSIAAVLAGAEQVQGTINGYGERCGNANLISIIPGLQLKLGISCVPENSLKRLRDVSLRICEIANFNANSQQPYVGSSAFAHKGGIHVAAVEKVAASYEHITPESVGNVREVLVSELSGRGNIRVRAAELGIDTSGLEVEVLGRIKELESQGFQFENAEGSFELLLRRIKDGYKSPFEIVDFTVISEKRESLSAQVQAVVRVKVNGEILHTVADGIGPVNALDGAMRKALLNYFPEISNIHLVDYKVRILDPEHATAAVTRVMIEATNGEDNWCTIGCSENIIEASLHALTDSFEYYLLKHK
ncbi:MAG: citramalate synthase [Deltaproteobacteria bacterium]|nr:citramalate synthase [Deltaproteobacteria bacterium]